MILVFLVFSPCWGAKFLNWDDYTHYVSNPCVYSLSWDNIRDLFKQTINDTYLPLTILSFNLEYHLFGLSPYIAHLINILLHLSIVGMIFDLALMLKFSFWESLIASMIFALHPMHVESVAWVTERKDVLGILFYVLCIKHYWLYLERNSRKHYWVSIIAGFLSVMTKSMAISIPWVLLLLDWYHQRRLSKAVWVDKLPFVLLIFPIASITFFKLSPHPHMAHNSLLVGVWSFAWYLEKFLWPFNFLPAYSPPQPLTFSNLIYLRSLIICIAFISSMVLWRKRRLYILACLWWVLTIFFFWRFDFTDTNIVADRFMYLPSLGFCLLLGKVLSKYKFMAVLVIMVLGYLTFNQCQIWKDDKTLWSWTLAHDPKNEVAKENQDALKYDAKKKIVDYQAVTQAIDRNSGSAEDYLLRGNAFLLEVDFDLALKDFNKAIKIDPSKYMSYNMRGELYALRGEDQKALEDFKMALALKPDNAIAYAQTTRILKSMHQINPLFIWFDQALMMNPLMGEIYYQRGLLFQELGDHGKAIDEFKRAMALNNGLKEDIYYDRGKSYEALKQFDLACKDFEGSLKNDPANIKSLNELGIIYVMNKEYDKAMEVFNKAISMHPYDDKAYSNRGLVDIQQKQYSLALNDYSKAISLELYPYHALIIRGDIYLLLGQSQKAFEDYNLASFFAQGDTLAKIKRDHLIVL